MKKRQTQSIKKILIANRGEIAIRISQTCQKMGIKTVAIYSEADKNALFVQKTDEAIYIGGFQAAESYLDQNKVIAAAKQTKADAIHPAYGFLAENANFAQRCEDEGIIFIGPNPAAIAAMGSKIRAKAIMKAQGVPVIAGYNGAEQSVAILSAEALKIGFPVLLKASAGGGGKGMRIVRDASQLEGAIQAAKRESLAAFGDDSLLIEKYFETARHIEFQIFGDQHGNAVHCFERECSIQRRYQKIIEESPSLALSPSLRQQMGDAAVAAAKAINYDNAGTVEFILTPQNEFYFLEVNTRLQVEHPVTELITNLDLVQLQIEVAEGHPLPFQQSDLTQNGHAIECRIYAEDPNNHFLPATGTIQLWKTGNTPHIRYDSGVTTHSKIDIYYDPMIAKVIVHAPTRPTAIRLITKALEELSLLGITSNKDFLVAILNDHLFQKGQFDTHFLTKSFNYQKKTFDFTQKHTFAIAATLWSWHFRRQKQTTLQQLPTAWRNNYYQSQLEYFQFEGDTDKTTISYFYYADNQAFEFTIDDKKHFAELLHIDPSKSEITCLINNHRLTFSVAETTDIFYLHQPSIGTLHLTKIPRFPDAAVEEIKGAYRSPMPAEVVKVLVKAGQKIEVGDPLLVLLSMKMENTIEAFEAGTVEEVYVNEKDFVEADTLLLKLKD